MFENQPVRTAEAVARDMHGRVEFHLDYTLVTFETKDDLVLFKKWLSDRRYDIVNETPRTIGYAAMKVTA